MQDCLSLVPLEKSSSNDLASLPNFNFTNQDFDSLKTRLTLYIQQRFGDEFKDFVESSLGIMLMEMWAFTGDMLSFKMDQISNECYIDSVTELSNAFRICNQVGFEPTPPLSAKALFSATINSVLQNDLIIPAGFSVFTTGTDGSNVNFELYPADSLNNPVFDQDAVILAGNFTNSSIIGIEGVTTNQGFTSTGEINQQFEIQEPNVLFDSVQVLVDGLKWDRVNYFTTSDKKEFRVVFNSDYSAVVIFGDGKGGLVPSQGSQVNVIYRLGGGTRGNIITGAIQFQSGFNVDGLNITIPVSITNYTKANYGYDGDTLDDIKRKLPAYNKSQDRAVTAQDYKNLAELYVSAYNGQIGKGLAALRNHGCAGNIVDLFILARDGANGLQLATDQLKIELSEYIETKKMITHYVCIKDGTIKNVDVQLDVIISKFYRKFSEEIKQKILTRVNNFFILSNWDYGKSLKNIELVQVLSDVKEIKSIEIAFTTNDPEQTPDVVIVQYHEIIRSDQININMIFE